MPNSTAGRVFSVPQPRVLWLLLNIGGACCLLLGPPACRVPAGLYFCLFGGGLLFFLSFSSGRLHVGELAALSVVLSMLGATFLGIAVDSCSVLGRLTSPIYQSGIPVTICGIAWLVLTVASSTVRRSPLADAEHMRQKWSRLDCMHVGYAVVVTLTCVSGALLMRCYNCNLVLLTGYAGCALVVLVVASRCCVLTNSLSLVVGFLSIALVLSLPLRCCHLFGTDIHTEYWWFQTTFVGSYDVLRHANTPLSVCASISVLPSMLQGVTHLSPEPLMQFLYPCLFSLAPVALFSAWRCMFGVSVGFLAAIYFMSQEVFLDATCNPRTVTAVLFLAAFMLVLTSVRLRQGPRYFLLLVCGIGCLISHYSTSYVWLAVLVSAVVWKCLLTTRVRSVRVGLASAWRGAVSLPGAALFSLAILFLYGYATGPAWDAGVRRLRCALTHLHELLDIEARGGSFEGLMSVGSSANTIPRNIDLVVTWLCFALIGVGLLSSMSRLLRARGESDHSLDSRHLEVLALAAGASTVLLLSTVAPRIFAGYSMRRTYIVAMLVLSPYLVIGAGTLGQHLRLPKPCMEGGVVVLCLLCATSVLYQLWGVPKDAVLNTTGLEYDLYYVTDSEAAACAWLSDVSDGMPVVGDRMGGPRLLSQGHLDLEQVCAPDVFCSPTGGAVLVYLRRENLQTGRMTTKSREILTLENVTGLHADRLFASGQAEVMSSDFKG